MRVREVRQGSARQSTLGYAITSAICLAGLALAYVIDSRFSNGMSPALYIPVHALLEIVSVVVSFAVFAIGWYGYRQTRNRQDLLIAVAFLVVGAIDIVHTLSYKGMPDFLGVNTPGKAAAYWLVARLVAALALLYAAFVSPVVKSRAVKPAVLLSVAAAIVAVVVTAISLNDRTVSNLMYAPGLGLTPLKKGLEYTVIALNIAAFWAFARPRSRQIDSMRLLPTALIMSIGSELCFSFYHSPYDMHNLLGHVLKVVAYYLVMQALFVSSLRRPHIELSQAKEQLQVSFSRIGEALAAGLMKEPTLSLISSLARQMLNADVAAIGEVNRDNEMEISTFDGASPETMRVPLRESIAGETFVTRSPLLVNDLRQHPKARPEMLDLGARSFISAPIVHDGRPAGAIYVLSRIPGHFTAEDAEVLTAFAGHAAVALGNAEHYEREHHIAEALQQVIFPPPDLTFNGLEIAGKYRPAWDEARVGGDFYDYFDLGGGKLGIVVGDVSGKGLNAAVHTAIVKYSLQTYLREGYALPEAFTRLDGAFKERALSHDTPESVFVTLFCAIVDSATGRIEYVNAGHEPPIIMSATGDATGLDSTGPILGLGIGMKFGESEAKLESGEVLVLYTDGITESRKNGHLFGFDGLVGVLEGCKSCTPREIAELVYERAKNYAEGVVRDDVALIVVRRH